MPKKLKARGGGRSGGGGGTPKKAEIVAHARRIYATFGCTDDRISCLYWTAAVIAAARHRSLRLIVQGGSASFLTMPPEDDDGYSPTHYYYQWEGNTGMRLMDGKIGLPEMHVWAADPQAGELIDLTTAFLPELAGVAGLVWTAEDPPPYIWTKNLPQGWHYEANREATLLAHKLITDLIG